MPSDKHPPLMADRIAAAYRKVYGIEPTDKRATPTYEPFMEGYLACHRDRGPYPPPGVAAAHAPTDPIYRVRCQNGTRCIHGCHHSDRCYSDVMRERTAGVRAVDGGQHG